MISQQWVFPNSGYFQAVILIFSPMLYVLLYLLVFSINIILTNALFIQQTDTILNILEYTIKYIGIQY